MQRQTKKRTHDSRVALFLRKTSGSIWATIDVKIFAANQRGLLEDWLLWLRHWRVQRNCKVMAQSTHMVSLPLRMLSNIPHEDIGQLLVSRMYNLTEAEIAERVINFVEHLQREDHYKHDQHQDQLEQLEKEFHDNNTGPPVNTFLSVRPRMFLDSSPALLTCTQS